MKNFLRNSKRKQELSLNLRSVQKYLRFKNHLEVQYEEKLVEEVEEIKTALTERVDSYLEYVSTEWMSENRLSVEAGT